MQHTLICSNWLKTSAIPTHTNLIIGRHKFALNFIMSCWVTLKKCLPPRKFMTSTKLSTIILTSLTSSRKEKIKIPILPTPNIITADMCCLNGKIPQANVCLIMDHSRKIRLRQTNSTRPKKQKSRGCKKRKRKKSLQFLKIQRPKKKKRWSSK